MRPAGAGAGDSSGDTRPAAPELPAAAAWGKWSKKEKGCEPPPDGPSCMLPPRPLVVTGLLLLPLPLTLTLAVRAPSPAGERGISDGECIMSRCACPWLCGCTPTGASKWLLGTWPTATPLEGTVGKEGTRRASGFRDGESTFGSERVSPPPESDGA